MEKKSLLIIVFGFILLNVILISADNPLNIVFSNSYSGIVALIISLIPAIILMLITYLSLKKASRSLMTLQVLLWFVFTFYVCIRAFAFLDYNLNLGFMPQNAITYLISDNVPTSDTELFWFQLSIYVNAGIGLIMSFGNGIIRKIFLGTK